MMELREINTYAGPTSVNAGNLLVRKALASPVTVNAGGTLNGNVRFPSSQEGPFGDITAAGGTVDPGNDHSGGDFGPRAAAGLMLANGDVAFDADSTFHVDIGGTTAGAT